MGLDQYLYKVTIPEKLFTKLSVDGKLEKRLVDKWLNEFHFESLLELQDVTDLNILEEVHYWRKDWELHDKFVKYFDVESYLQCDFKSITAHELRAKFHFENLENCSSNIIFAYYASY